jgi:hypothetical protein
MNTKKNKTLKVRQVKNILTSAETSSFNSWETSSTSSSSAIIRYVCFLQPNQTSPIKEGIPDPSLIYIFLFATNPPTSHLPLNTTKTFKKKKTPLAQNKNQTTTTTYKFTETNKQTIPETKYNYDLSIQNQNHSTQLQTLKACMTLFKEEAAKRKERWRLFLQRER